MAHDNPDQGSEPGDVDTFSLETQDLGQSRQVRIRHDSSGLGPGWWLDQIGVRNETTGQELVFACNQWLDTKEGDGKIALTLDRAP